MNPIFFFFYVKSVDHPEIRGKKIDKEMVSRKKSTEHKGLLKWNTVLIKYFESCICVPPERAVLKSAL